MIRKRDHWLGTRTGAVVTTTLALRFLAAAYGSMDNKLHCSYGVIDQSPVVQEIILDKGTGTRIEQADHFYLR